MTINTDRTTIPSDDLFEWETKRASTAWDSAYTVIDHLGESKDGKLSIIETVTDGPDVSGARRATIRLGGHVIDVYVHLATESVSFRIYEPIALHAPQDMEAMHEAVGIAREYFERYRAQVAQPA